MPIYNDKPCILNNWYSHFHNITIIYRILYIWLCNTIMSVFVQGYAKKYRQQPHNLFNLHKSNMRWVLRADAVYCCSCKDQSCKMNMERKSVLIHTYLCIEIHINNICTLNLITLISYDASKQNKVLLLEFCGRLRVACCCFYNVCFEFNNLHCLVVSNFKTSFKKR